MNLLYLIAILMLMLLSFLFSGTETGVYRFSRFRLRLGVEQKRKSFAGLSRMIEDGQNLILSLLLGNNMVNYFMTTLFTIVLYKELEDEQAAEMYTSLILTPVVFVFCEMIPKSIFYYKADVLLPRLYGFLKTVYTLFRATGALRLFKGLFTLVLKAFHLSEQTVKAVDRTQRLQVNQLLHETQEEGLLSDVQKDMIGRLIRIPDVSVGSVMVPLAQFGKVELHAGQDELLRLLQDSPFTHCLVYDTSPNHVVGYLWLCAVLGGGPQATVQEFMTPLPEIERSASAIEAISLLRKRTEKIALVIETANDKRQAVGVITTVDLMEELVGEVT